jgi:pimeloyl-ACP methyl ester carboxylesterase
VSRLRIQVLAATVFVLAWMQSAALGPKHESGVLPIDPPTPYIHYFGETPNRGRVLVVHGLDVSKETIGLFSSALADGGFDVYAMDLPGHGDSKVGFQTDLAQQAISNAKRYLGEKIFVAGHSMGAGLLLDLAETEQFSTMVLLSPPPISIAEIHAERVLIATDRMDIPRIRSFVPIAADIGSPNVEAWDLPWGGHSALIHNPAYVRQIVEWLGGDGTKTRTTSRLLWLILMFAAAVTFGVSLLPGRPLEFVDVSASTIFARYIVAFGVGLLVLKFVNPMGWVRLFATDYLIGFFFVAGLCSLAMEGNIKTQGHRGRSASAIAHSLKKGIATAMLAAVFVIGIPGFLVVSRALHMSLSDGRWWRFPCFAIAAFPLFMSDELAIRHIQPRWKSEMVALLTRILLLAFLLTGVLTINRGDAFLVLIAPLITVFWIALWFASGVIHRHTQCPIAAAMFAAILQGWAFAAWFVTI